MTRLGTIRLSPRSSPRASPAPLGGRRRDHRPRAKSERSNGGRCRRQSHQRQQAPEPRVCAPGHRAPRRALRRRQRARLRRLGRGGSAAVPPVPRLASCFPQLKRPASLASRSRKQAPAAAHPRRWPRHVRRQPLCKERLHLPQLPRRRLAAWHGRACATAGRGTGSVSAAEELSLSRHVCLRRREA